MKDSTEEYREGLSKTESFLLASLARSDKNVFTSKDAREALGRDASGVMHSLMRKKWVLPLKKGLYVAVPLEAGVRGAEGFTVHSFVVASYLADPYCIAFWSALNHHGLSDQIPLDTFVQTTTAKKPVKFLNSFIVFVQLKREKIFGIEKIEMEGREISITNKEKTVADCLDHPEHSGGIEEVARSIFFAHNELDFSRVRKYARNMGNLTVFKRLGYVLERTGLLNEYDDVFKGIRLSKGYSVLDPLGPKKGKYNERWKVIANVEIDPERWMY